jgi:hypothetical protein
MTLSVRLRLSKRVGPGIIALLAYVFCCGFGMSEKVLADVELSNTWGCVLTNSEVYCVSENQEEMGYPLDLMELNENTDGWHLEIGKSNVCVLEKISSSGRFNRAFCVNVFQNYAYYTYKTPPFVMAIFDGSYDNICITKETHLKCWRDLGRFPLTVTAFEGLAIMGISISYNHMCVLDDKHQVHCRAHELNQTSEDYQRPSGWNCGQDEAPNDSHFDEIGTGRAHTCALTTGGRVVCWGVGDDRRRSKNGCKHKALVDRGQTAGVEGVFSSIDSGSFHNCAVNQDSTVKCWGDNRFGQLNSPEKTKFREISCGGDSVCGITTEGSLECWGKRADLEDGLASSVTGHHSK